jgi:hypothetical protein
VKQDFASGGTRRLALEAFSSLAPSWLRLHGVGPAQICTGDSGAPSILSGTTLVTGITSLEMSGGGASREVLSHSVDLP